MDTLDNTVYNDPAHGGQLPPDVESQMRSTTPWMRFIAIIGFIGIFLMIGISIVTMIYNPQPRTMGAFVGYLLMAVIMFFPFLFLMQSANYFKGYIVKRDHHSLLRSFVKQKAYWRYMGIFMVVYLVILLIAIVLGIIAAGSAMM
jgi:magnesium-transporting ATPase (P-type)